MNARVEELLSAWERAEPKPTAEELCKDDPGLLAAVRQRLSSQLHDDERRGGDADVAEGGAAGGGEDDETGLAGGPALAAGPSAPPGAPSVEGYQITGRLGRGGMGVVWLAVQLGTRRKVALKLLIADHFSSERARARFVREVELAASLEHSNIARVYDSGLHRGVYYYAMEFVDGLPLDGFVAMHRLGLRQILLLMKRVCRAVYYAHERGIIHRDLKPSNILVGRDGQPRVLDFGLAKLMEGDPGAGVSVSGEVAGTPAHMSPEQAAGR